MQYETKAVVVENIEGLKYIWLSNLIVWHPCSIQLWLLLWWL